MKKDELRELIKEELSKAKEEKKEEKKVSKVSVSVTKLADKIGDKIAEAILEAKKVSKTKENKDYLKHKLFTPETGLKAIKYPDSLDNLTKEQTIAVWFKSLVMKDRDEESYKVFRALNEGTSAEGGYLVPTPLATEIWRTLPDLAVMRRIARIIPMTSKTLDLNTLAARPTAYWTSEYAQKTTSSAEFGRVQLSVNDLVCLIAVTDQLVADANINIVQYIVELFTEAIAAEEDKAFFTGSGTGRPKGITQETLSSTAVGATFNFDDLLNLIYLVPSSVRTRGRGTAFVAHANVIKKLRAIKDSQNRYIWEQSTQVGQPNRIYGYPIYEQNDLPQSELYFGDWKYYIIGDRQQITVETTREGGDAWRRNAIEIKAVERVDGKAVLTTPFAKATGI